MIIRSMKCSLTLMILYLLVLISSGYALAEENQPNILVLNSYHQGENWTDNEIAGIFSELLTQYPTMVPLVEALDTKRYPSPAHLDFLKDYLLRKYHDRRIDLIIALDNPALNLITQNPTELFPDVPVVFAGINGFRPEMIADRKKITGVIERQDVAGTLKMALAMHPKVSRILAVHDYTASGLAVRQETETALAQFAGKLQISYSADVPFDRLSEELKKMPDNGLVLILTYVTDKAGHTYSREESTRLISSLSPVPVYAMHETRLGYGIMGGLLLEGKEHGRQAARLAFRILQGEDPDRIAVEESHSRSILDYEGLRRLKIPEDLWPKDALVVNRPISFWSRHRNVLIPSIAAIVMLLGLSSMLLGTVIRLRRAKKTIHKSEEKYRVLFNSFPLGITVSDQDGKIVETNAMAANILSVPKEEHEARKVDGGEWRIIRPDGTPMPVGEYASTRALKEKCLIENREMGIVHQDAETTWLSVTAAPLPLEGYGVVVTYTDISERKRAAEYLRQSEERLQNLVESIGEGIILQDASERILLWNTTASELFDLDADHIVGQPASHHEWSTIREDGSPFPVQDHPSLHTLRTGQACSGVIMGVERKDHDTRWIKINTRPLFAREEPNPYAVIISFSDFTERKKIEEEQKKLQSQLIQAQKMEAIGTLAGGIAHDFNNILGAILGYAEMAADDCPADSKVAYNITQVVKAGNRARELVKQILAFSRQTETDFIPLQPAVIITEALKLLRSSLPTTITIIQEIDRDAGDVLADPIQIHQVVMNLCTNAFHAMEKDGGILEVSLKKKELTGKDLLNEPHLQPGNYLQLSIRDTGVGIAPEDLERIFDPYFTTKEVGKGTGMGLSIAHGIVKNYGGSITCDSRPGEGTVFHIILPAVDSSSLQAGEKTEVIPGGNEHILLIDDEELLVEMSKRMLERLGYRVTAQTDSIKALAMFQNQPQEFDLVITDQTMPGMTGSKLAQRMLLVRSDLPIILCTGYSTLMSEEKAHSLGIKGFAMKPLTKKDIATLIRKVLDELA